MARARRLSPWFLRGTLRSGRAELLRSAAPSALAGNFAYPSDASADAFQAYFFGYQVPAGFRLWDPDDLTVSPNVWLDASDTANISLTGASVNSWTSRGAHAVTLVNRSAGSKPTYVRDGLNGRPVISGDGVDDCILADPTGATNAQWNGSDSKSANVFMVAKYTSGTVWFKWENFPNRWGVESTGTWDYPTFSDRLDTLTYPTTPNVFYFAPNGGTKTVYYNDTADASTEAFSSSSGSVTGYLSMFASSDGNFPAKVDIAEVVHLNYNPSSTEIDQITGYLAWKYGLEGKLPLDHPYRHAPPLVSVATIHEGLVTDAATSSETVVGTRIQAALATDASTSAETVVGTRIQTGASTEAATSGETIAGTRIQTGASTDASTSAETSAGTLIQTGVVTDAATSATTADGEIIAPDASVTDAATSGETIVGTLIHGGASSDAATSAETITGTRIQTGASTDVATSAETVVGTRIQTGASTDASTSSETLAGTRIQTGTVTDAATSSETATEGVPGVVEGLCTSAATSATTAAGTRIQMGASTDASTSAEASVGVRIQGAASSDAATSAETAVGVRIQLASVLVSALAGEDINGSCIFQGGATLAALSAETLEGRIAGWSRDPDATGVWTPEAGASGAWSPDAAPTGTWGAEADPTGVWTPVADPGGTWS